MYSCELLDIAKIGCVRENEQEEKRKGKKSDQNLNKQPSKHQRSDKTSMAASECTYLMYSCELLDIAKIGCVRENEQEEKRNPT